MGLWALILICCSTFLFLANVGLRLTLGFLTISPSRVSPFNHIGTLPLQRKHSQPRVPLLVPPFILMGHAYLELFARKTFDTGTLLHSSEPILTIGSDTTCQVLQRGFTGENNINEI